MLNTKYEIPDTRYAFSLVEILIVVAILGILAAIALPQFQSQSTQAKEAAAKDNLRTLRNAIEIYTAQHNSVPPGYPGGNTSATPHWAAFKSHLIRATDSSGYIAVPGTEGYPLGPYISDIPENPFNNLDTITIIYNNEDFPAEPTGSSGWIYKPQTKQIRLNWTGTDSKATPYYDY